MLVNWWLKRLQAARSGKLTTQPIRNERYRSFRPRLERLESRVQPTVNLISHFAGINFGQSGGFVPPDTCGAASSTSNAYVETVNQELEIFNKSTGASVAMDGFDHFLFTVGGLPHPGGSPFRSDPIVVWDEQIQRFIVGDQDTQESGTFQNNFDIAVSKSGNPTTLTTADWNFYSINCTENTNAAQTWSGLAYSQNFFADYPGNFGWNHDAFVLTLNMFGQTSGGHVLVVAVNAQDLQNGVTQANLHVFHNDLNDFDDRPTVMHDSVAGDPMWLITEHGDNKSIDVIKVTNLLSNSETFTYTNLAVTPYFGVVAPKQPDGSNVTTNIDSRIQKSAEANNTIVAAHAISNAAGDRDMIRWYKINVSGTPTLSDQGNVVDAASGAGSAGFYDVYPAIDISPAGTIGLTYAQSGTAAGQFVSMYVTGRLPGDAAGTMEAPVLVQAGAANLTDNREGDLAGISVDSDGSFWSANEVANTAGNRWTTNVAHFSVTSPFDISVNVSGTNLVVANLNTAIDDTLTIKVVGTNYRVSDPNHLLTTTTGTLVDAHTVDIAIASVTGNIQFNTGNGKDSLTVDYSGGNFSSAIADNPAGPTGESLTLTGGTFTGVVYAFSNLTSGAVTVGAQSISFANLHAGITDNLTVTNRTFNYNGGAETITVTNPGGGNTTLSSTLAQAVTFLNPTASLQVNAGTGNDQVLLNSLAGGFAAAFDGGAGTDTLTSNINTTATWSLQSGVYTDTAAARSITFTTFEQLNGGPGTDTLIGANVANTWTITGANAGAVSGVSFTGMENLTGGTSTDLFTFNAAGSIGGNLDGAAGSDTLNFTAKASQTVTIAALGSTDGFKLNVTGGFIGGTLDNLNAVTASSGATDVLTGGLSVTATWNLGANLYTDVTDGRTLGFTNFETLNGSSGADTLIGANIANTWTITAAGGGTVGAIAFTAMENLVGGSNTDNFIFATGGSITGNLDGGNGADTLDFSAQTSQTATITALGTSDGFKLTITGGFIGGTIDDMNSVAASFAGTTDVLTSGLNVTATWNLATGLFNDTTDGRTLGFANFETLNGGAGIDTLIGPNSANTWNITGANAGNITGSVTFTGMENLTGGTSIDNFIFGASGSISGAIDGAAGADNIDFSAKTSQTVTLTATGATDGFNGTIGGGFLGNFANINFITASSAGTTDALVGLNAAATWNITGANGGNYVSANTLTFNNMENLTGGSGTDGFIYAAGGSIAGNIDGQGGSDTVDFSTKTSQAVALSATGGVDGFNGTITGGFLGGTFANINAIVASLTGVGDSLAGISAAAAWNINAANSGTYTSTNVLAWSNVESLIGGSSADSFLFALAGTLGGNIDGAGGSDTLDFSAKTSQTVALTATGGADGFNGTISGGFLAAGFLNIDAVVASSAGATDTLLGVGAAATWNITGANAGSYTSANTLAWSNVENLTGAGGADGFVFAAAGSIGGNIDAGGGIDTIDFSAKPSQTVTLAASGADGFNGTIGGGFLAGTFANANAIIASLTGTADKLVGINAAATWSISAASAGAYTSTNGLSWSNVENLTGGSGADNFIFAAAGSISGSVDGLGGSDTVDFSAKTAQAVTLTGTGGTDGFNGSITGGFVGTTFANINAVAASSAGTTDTLTGVNAAATWNVNGANSGNYTSTNVLAWSNVEGLTGGSGADNFIFAAAGSIGGSVDGLGGSDTVDFSARTSQTVTLNALGATDGFAGTIGGGFLGGTFADINAISASSAGASDMLVGLNAAASWSIGGANSGTYSSTNALTWTNVENLAGGTLADGFVFGAVGSIAGKLDGGAGSDTLDNSAIAGAQVIVTGNGTTDGLQGTATGIGTTFDNVNSIVSNTITGPNQNNIWIITGLNTGTLNGTPFTAANLVGGTLTDKFIFQVGGRVTSINGGTGSDSIDFSALAGPLTVTLAGAGGSDGFNGAVSGTIITGSFGNIDSLTGSSGSDTLAGLNAAATWNITAANAGSYASTNTLAFSAFENLTGGSGADGFVFGAASALAGSIDGAAGSDTVDYSALASQTVTLTGTGATDGFSGSISGGFLGGGFANIDAVAGSSSGTADVLAGINAAATWNITAANAGNFISTNSLKWSNIENLTGNAGADNFIFGSAGSIAGQLNGGAGSDTLDNSAVAGSQITVTGAGTTDGAQGTATGVGSTFDNINNFATNTLTGPNQANVWNITGINSGTLNGLGFVAANLVGGTLTDNFIFAAAGRVATINGGAGSDSIDLSALAGPVTVTLTALGGTDGFSGTVSGSIVTGSFSNINSFTGTAGSDTLIGLGAGATWNISAANSGGYTSTNTLAFASIENLTGGAGADGFIFAAAGSVSGNVDGGGGSDTVDFSAKTSQTVTLTAAGGVDGFSGGVTGGFLGGTFANINAIAASSAGTTDALVGLNAAATWSITAANAGSYAGTNTLTWNNIESLTGGGNTDSFVFAAAGTLAGTIDGAGGSDTVDFAAKTSQTVTLTGLGATDGFNGTIGGGFLAGSFANINAIAASSTGTTDNLIGINAAATWNISGLGAGNYTSTNALAWTNVENLTGGSSTDNLVFAAAGSIAGSIDGGAGNDTVDYSAKTAQTVTLTAAGVSDGFNGAVTGGFLGGTFANINAIVGSSAGTTDTLIGLSAAAAWNITGTNSGAYTSGSTLAWSNIENLTGGSNADGFVFAAGGSISGNVDGLGGSDTVDFAAKGSQTVALSGVGGADGFSGSIGGGFLGGTFANINAIVASSAGTVDVLVGLNAAATWNLTAANGGTYASGNTLTWSNFENLTGGSGADNYIFATAGAIGGNIDGLGGIDTVDFSAKTSQTVTLSGAGGTDGFNGNIGGGFVGGTFANINAIVASSAGAADALIGVNAAATWNITAANAGAYLSGNSLAWSNVESLTGGSGADNFVFAAAGSIGGNIEGLGGSDLVDFSAKTSQTVSLSSTGGVDGFNGTISGGFLGGVFANINAIAASSAGTADGLVGLNAASTWTITAANAGTYQSTNGLTWSNLENLAGGTGNDTFTFGASGSIGAKLDGGAGNNTLDNSAIPGAQIVNTGPGTITGFTGTAGGVGTIFDNINNEITNTIVGPNQGNTWIIDGVNTGTLNGVRFFATNLIGGSSTDNFIFLAGGRVTSINGSGGSDTIDFSALAGPITVTLTSLGGADGFNGTVSGTIITGSFSNVNSIIGTTGSDTLIGLNATAAWNIAAANGGNYVGTNILAFTSFENLTGGSGADGFVFGASGSLSGNLDGGAGTDTVDYSTKTSQTVTLGGAGGTDGFNGSISGSFLAGGFANIDAVAGSLAGTTDTVLGLNAAATWNVTGANSGNYVSTNTLGWNNIENLSGGSNNDSFVFGNGASIAGAINGAAGADKLDWTAYTTGRNVVVTGLGTTDGFNGAEASIGGGFQNIDAMSGSGAAANSLTGLNNNAIWNLTTNLYTDLPSGRTLNFTTFTVLNGGTATDSITGPALANTWNISGNNSGTVVNGNGSIVFSGMENLVGSTGADLFKFSAVGSISGSVDGGAGSDSLDWSGLSTARNATLTTVGTVDGFKGAETSIPGGFDNINAIMGTTATDTLTGNNANNTWNITGSSTGNINSAANFTFSSFENLTGGSLNDKFVFSNSAVVGGAIDGGVGSDTLDWTAYTTGRNVVLTALGVTDGFNGSETSVAGGFKNVGGLVGSGSAANSLAGLNASATWDLTTSLYTTGGRSISFVTFTTLNGGTATDTLIGPASTNIWNINGANAGSIAVGATIFAFGGMENLSGGSLADDFVFASAGSISGNIDGGAGADTLDFSAKVAQAVTIAGLGATDGFNLTATASFIGGTITNTNGVVGSAAGTTDVLTSSLNLTANWNLASGAFNDATDGRTMTFANFETLNGGPGIDTVSGANAANTWNITGASAGTVGGVAFTGMENLTGGTSADSFVFAVGGNVVNLDGGAGSDAVDYSAKGSQTVTLTGAGSTDGFNGTISGGFLAGSFSNINTINGGSGTSDKLIGQNAAATWNITAANAGNYVSSGNTVSFAGIENLSGGSGNDTFVFGNNTTVSGAIDGGSGSDTLDWSAYTTGRTVTLTALGTIDGFKGTEASIAGGFDNIEGLTGSGAGNDNLIGVNANAIWNGATNQYTALGHTLIFGGFEVFTGGTALDTLDWTNNNNTWNITGANAGTINTSLAFTGMENLVGGNLIDTFKFGAAGSISGMIDGGAGGNALDYSTVTAGVLVNLQTNNATAIGGTFANIQSATGGSGSDTVFGANAATTWNITGVNIGSVNGSFNFAAFENLTGGTGADDFVFAAAGSIGGVVDGGLGSDTLDVTAVAGSNVTVTGTGTLDGLKGAATGTGSFDNVNSIAANTVTGPNQANVWIITGINIGTLNGAAFSAANLIGGSQTDTFIFQPGGSVNSVDGGASGDTVDFSALTGPITVTLTGLGATDGFNGTVSTAITSSFANINAMTATASAADTLIGQNAAANWNVTAANAGSYVGSNTFGFTAFENLTGGSGNDTFKLSSGVGIGGIIDGGAGTNTLDYSLYTTAVSVSLLTGTATNIGGGFANVENFIGGSSSDSITGNNGNNTWNITAANAGNINAATTFSSFENLSGGSGNDSFKLSNGAGVTGIIDGGGGANTLDYSLVTTPVTVNLLTSTSTNVGGFANIQNFVGGSGSDTLIGDNNGDAWNITSNNAGNINGGTSFASFENLTGGTGNDTFKLNNGAGVNGTVNGGGGTNTLDYSVYTTAVTVNLQANTATNVGGLASLQNFVGGLASDRFIGPNGNNLWSIKANNAGNINGSTTFSSFENLTGGTGNDTFQLSDGVGVGGTINGGGGTNTLDYSLYTVAVTINLGANTATNVGGIVNLQNFIGTAQTDTFIGPNTNDTWNLTANNAGNINGTTTFSSFEDLTGGTASDAFKFSDGVVVSGTIDGGSGADTLDWSLYTTARNVTLTGVGTTDGFKGSEASIAGGFDNIDGVMGSGASSDTLNGLNAAATWTVNASSTYGSGGRTLGFGGFETLNGGSAVDTFEIQAVSFAMTANGNDGNDIFNVGSSGNSLSGITAPLTVNGGVNAAAPTTSFTCGGTTNTLPTGDVVNFNDQGAAGGTYTLSDTTFQRTGAALIAYGTIETVVVNAGTTANAINVTTSAASANTFINGGAANDTISLGNTGANSNVQLNGFGGDDQIDIRATSAGSLTDVHGGAGNDTIAVSSNAGVDDNGTVASILGAMCLDGEAGTGNRLIVSNFGGAGVNATITGSSISGLAPATIYYSATGGNYTNGASNNGILIRGSDTADDTFLITSTLAGSTTAIEGNGGADTFNVGSTLADNNGNLDAVQGLLTLLGGANPAGTQDQILINDHGNPNKANYSITPTSVTNMTGAGIPARTFAGINYDGSTEFLRLDGTDAVNVFRVKPSLTTEIMVNGNLPPPGTPAAQGDKLILDRTGLTGVQRHDTGSGQGYFTFTSGQQQVDFISIEGLNQAAGILAVSADASSTGRPMVNAYDLLTKQLKFQIRAYETTFHGGVRVATGDVNGDGFADIITAPGRGHSPLIKIFDGTTGGLLTSFSAFSGSFTGGLNLAMGDVNGDGILDLVVGAGVSNLPLVEVFDGATLLTTHKLIGSAFDGLPSTWRGGVSVAAGDLNGDGFADIVTASNTAGYSAIVKVFNGKTFTQVNSFPGFPAPYSGGVTLAVGDFNGDGKSDIICGQGSGGVPLVTVYDGSNAFQSGLPPLLASFFAYATTYRGGVKLATKSVSGGDTGSTDQVDILIGFGTGNSARNVRRARFNGINQTPILSDEQILGSDFSGGAYVG